MHNITNSTFILDVSKLPDADQKKIYDYCAKQDKITELKGKTYSGVLGGLKQIRDQSRIAYHKVSSYVNHGAIENLIVKCSTHRFAHESENTSLYDQPNWYLSGMQKVGRPWAQLILDKDSEENKNLIVEGKQITRVYQWHVSEDSMKTLLLSKAKIVPIDNENRIRVAHSNFKFALEDISDAKVRKEVRKYLEHRQKVTEILKTDYESSALGYLKRAYNAIRIAFHYSAAFYARYRHNIGDLIRDNSTIGHHVDSGKVPACLTDPAQKKAVQKKTKIWIEDMLKNPTHRQTLLEERPVNEYYEWRVARDKYAKHLFKYASISSI